MIHSESKNCDTIHSFITLTNIGRFSQFFHYCVLQKIYNKTCAISHRSLDVLLHDLATYKRPKVAKLCCILHNNTCLVFT